MRTHQRQRLHSLLAMVGAAAVVGGLLTASPATAAEDIPTCGGKAATIVGTEGDDVLESTDDFEIIVGLGGNDTIVAHGGGALLCGGDGDDVLTAEQGVSGLYGDEGDDRLVGSKGGDFMYPGPGNDQMIGRAGDETFYISSGTDDIEAGPGRSQDIRMVDNEAGVEVRFSAPGAGTATRPGLALTFSGINGVFATAYDDVIIGSSADEDFVGRFGNDRIEGRGGHDSIYSSGLLSGGAGDDSISVKGGTAHGGPGDDRLSGEHGDRDSLLRGGSGNDLHDLTSADNADVRAGAGDDVIKFNRGVHPNAGETQRLNGGSGHDFVDFREKYEAGRRLWIDLSSGHARSGDEKWTGVLTSIEEVRGTRGDDRIYGDAGDNVLDGSGGRDYVNGRGGRDTCTAEKTVNCER